MVLNEVAAHGAGLLRSRHYIRIFIKKRWLTARQNTTLNGKKFTYSAYTSKPV